MEYSNHPARQYQNCIAVAVPLFLVATAVTAIQYKIPTIMVPVMQQFGVGAYTASWLMSIFTFVGIVFSLPVGVLARRFQPKRIILAAVGLACVASLAGAFAQSVILLLATRALEGVSLVCIIACGPIVIQQGVDPGRRGTASGIWMLGGMIGATLAGVTTPMLYAWIGFSGLWLAYAAFAAVAGVVLAVVVRTPAADGGESRAVRDDQPFRERFKGEYGVFAKPNTWAFYLPFGIFQILLLSVLSYAPTSLQQQGMDASLSGFVSTLPMLIAVVSSVAFGALSDALHRCKPLFVVGMLAMALCTPVLLTFSGAPLWIAVVAMGLLAMGVPTVAISAYPSILGDPKLMTVGMGVLMLVQSVGQFLGSLVPASLLGPDLSQWTLCAAVLCGLGLVGTVSLLACKFR
ncbi:hypothetical protein C1878_05435 [Gordonibacter sp. 28C]|uniref:MFS transporter n=1 Tax=Gordonibacter sp. 28C TaxID=2078569 RepID=UPI000DF8216A|nr:MFS transporter [Gordonibacter sp. 28C]RDB63301.1 hypothetical protein C1878_05435 [Gordonibacter sp. 28C]